MNYHVLLRCFFLAKGILCFQRSVANLIVVIYYFVFTNPVQMRQDDLLSISFSAVWLFHHYYHQATCQEPLFEYANVAPPFSRTEFVQP